MPDETPTAVALDATVSGTQANSYVTVAEADLYFGAHYMIAKANIWSSFQVAQKVTLLRLACQIIETLPFEDNAVYRVVYNQALQIPRVTVDVVNGVYVIPQAVKDAQCEQAVYLAGIDESAMVAQMQGIWEESVKADTVSMGTVYSGGGVAASLLAPLAFQILRPFVRKGTGSVRRA